MCEAVDQKAYDTIDQNNGERGGTMAQEAKDHFFDIMEAQGTALTFDDVRLRTSPSEVAPAEVDITSQFSEHVELKTPIASAAMDTVTEAPMAIALAQLGGIGVIHAGLNPEEQRRQVRHVKYHLNGLIESPITVAEDDSLEAVLARCDEEGFAFRTFPVVNSEGHVVGLLTQNDFDFSDRLSERVSNVMTRDIMTAPKGTTIQVAYARMRDAKKKTLPLLNDQQELAGLYIWSDVNRLLGRSSTPYNLDDHGRLRVAAAVPTSPENALERVSLMRKYVDVVVIDTAQGDSRFAFETLRCLKESFPDLDVVVGNISEAASARKLAEAGANGIKVGQGPGSICTTRIETGIGCPQVTAVYECAKAVRGKNIPVCADGGIRNPGDVSIAIAAGASSVMLGSLLAGTNEAPGELMRLKTGQEVKRYRGMGSPSALRDSAAARLRYGSTSTDAPLAEGIESYVPYRGDVSKVVTHLVKALRKSMSYVGAPTIEHHQLESEFWRITNSGLAESHPHDVIPSN